MKYKKPPIKRVSIVVFALLLASFAAQSDSAVSITENETPDDTPVYIYLDYSFSRIADGLLSQYEDPRTRASVVEFFIDEIGDQEVAEALLNAAEKHRIDPALVVALSRQESGFQTTRRRQERKQNDGPRAYAAQFGHVFLSSGR